MLDSRSFQSSPPRGGNPRNILAKEGRKSPGDFSQKQFRVRRGAIPKNELTEGVEIDLPTEIIRVVIFPENVPPFLSSGNSSCQR